MGSVMELESALGRQLTLFRMETGVQTAACFLLTSLDGREVLRLRAHASNVTDLTLDLTLLPGETLVGLAAKEKRKVLLNSVSMESAKALPYYLKPQEVGSFLSMPLFLRPETGESRGSFEGELIGVLVLDHPSNRFFGEERVQAVELLCGLLSDLFQNHRVVHFSRTKTENLHTLYEVSRIFSASVELKPTLEAAVQQASKIAESDLVYIALREGESSRFKIHEFWAPSRGGLKPVELEEELASWVCQSKKPIRYSLGQREKWFPVFERQEGMLGSVQSFLLVPLLVEGRVMGVLRLNSRKPSAYGEYEQDVLQTLANQTALALDKVNKVETIRNLAVRDGLTGLYNHRHFQEKLTEEWIKSERYKKNLALILMDVDHFKKFNDTYGHPEGDKVLVGVSRILQETVRDKADTVARYGGEEFAVILPETDGREALDLGERIRKNVENQLFEYEAKKVYRVTLSLGVSCFPQDARDKRLMVQCADQALYSAKKNGRNQVQRYEPGMAVAG
jgi:diguanylate cyclase (GGDEF)-like protein